MAGKKIKERGVTLKTKSLVLRALTCTELEELLQQDVLPEKEAVFGVLESVRQHPEATGWYSLWTVRRRTTDELLGAFSFCGKDKLPTATLSLTLDLAPKGTPDLAALTGEALLAAAEWAQGQEGVYFTEFFAPDVTEERKHVLAGAGFAPDTVPGFEACWFRERPPFPAIPIYMMLGMSVGLALGSSMDKVVIGECIGISLGVALGAAVQAADHKSRAAALAKRKEQQTSAPEYKQNESEGTK